MLALVQIVLATLILVKDVGLPYASSPRDAAPKKTDLWITVGVIALIVAGMLLGAGLTRLWIGHFDQPPLIAPWP